MFSLIGALLVITGLVNGAQPCALNLNINLWWGVVLLVFGALMLLGAMRSRKTPPPA
jgi:uncharacterized membrane protein HdeD (DUF308 family)